MRPIACIGLDLSLTATGVCTAAQSTDTLRPPTEDRDARLRWLYEALGSYARSGRVLVVESPYVTGPARGGSTLVLGELYGVARLAFGDARVVWVPPASAKRYATGSGSATKPDMRMALYKRAGLDLRDENAVDAWWLWAMGMDHYGRPPIELPKTHRAALDAITWPEAA